MTPIREREEVCRRTRREGGRGGAQVTPIREREEVCTGEVRGGRGAAAELPPLSHAKRAANAPATRTAAAHVRSARSLSYAAEPCCAGECRIAYARERGLWSKGACTHRGTSLAPQREPHVRLLRDLSARSVRPPAHETPAQEGCCACVHAHAAVAIASGACQQQRLQAEAEHVPHQRGAVKPWALSPVSGGYWQGRNATRDLRFRAAWALHAALALHGSLVHWRAALGGHPVRLQTRRARACRRDLRGKR